MHPLIVEQVAAAKVADAHRQADAQRRANAVRRAPRIGLWQTSMQVVVAFASRSAHRPAQPRVARSGHPIHGRR
jgi:uncharacterized protein (DUF1015 family)